MARKMRRLLNGEQLSSASLPDYITHDLVDEGIFVRIPRGQFQRYALVDAQAFRTYLAQRYDIKGTLEAWIEIKSGGQVVKRSEQVRLTGNSKLRKTRSFKGFLVKCYAPVEATLHGESIVIDPHKGLATFVETYEHFRIPANTVVVGIENGENFQHIQRQQYLFEAMNVLFVSRYPQSKDLITWLQLIPNPYLHFGDFDLAGIQIFLSEFYASLGKRATFFIPEDIEERLREGNRSLYDLQYAKHKAMKVTDERLLPLVEIIHRYRRGYEQEGYIKL